MCARVRECHLSAWSRLVAGRGGGVRGLGVCVLVVVLLGLAGGLPSESLAVGQGCPVVRVSPVRSVEDEPVGVRVSGLGAGERVTLGLRARDRRGFVWASRAVVVADRAGIIDPNRAPSIGGSYRGVWSMGLIASMAPIKQAADRGFVWGRGADSFRLTVSAAGHVVAATSFWRSWGMHFSIRRETVRSAGFVGTFFAPNGATRHTSLVTLGGSEGGNSTTLLAARFAADGYPTLALAYFDAPGLPRAVRNIPLEYFQHALEWLARQPQVDPKRIVVDGFSRGTQAALLLAVHYPKLVHGVIAASPLNVNACGTHGLKGPPGCIGPPSPSTANHCHTPGNGTIPTPPTRPPPSSPSSASSPHSCSPAPKTTPNGSPVRQPTRSSTGSPPNTLVFGATSTRTSTADTSSAAKSPTSPARWPLTPTSPKANRHANTSGHTSSPSCATSEPACASFPE